MSYNKKIDFVFGYIFFSMFIIAFREKNTINILFPGCIIINNMIYYYVSKNQKKIIKPLKSRYSENMVITDDDIVQSILYDGYTIQGYMYLTGYYSVINILCILCDLVTHLPTFHDYIIKST